jgi:hypothetical protein
MCSSFALSNCRRQKECGDLLGHRELQLQPWLFGRVPASILGYFLVRRIQ